ncbi:MAG TPA: toll/interleukin-1 receptor domain-containing protein [Polyangiaceae bacterium]|nr:toll/interleukin-1 receptor domain-containing protein [Polyangiaceae bacterium]
MEEIVREGGWDALGLLTIAGTNLTGLAAELPIHTPNGKKKFGEFRQYCIERLQVRLGARQAPTAPSSEPIRVFMSYTHRDRVAANALALELLRAKADIFLDHWEMSPNDEILPRIERELRDSGAAVVLLSEASSASTWVQRELEIALRKQESDGNFLLLPVLLEPCSLPKALASRPYQDMRDPANRPYVAQAIVNEIFRTKPFSQRVAELLNEPPLSPYNQQARLNGFRLLQELAKHRGLEIANNQKRRRFDVVG